MSKEITLNAQQSLYVVPCGDGFTCFGFENARKHAEQISKTLSRPDLMPTAEMFGALAGYELYQKAVHAWGCSLMSKKTYFDPGTDPKVQKILEKYRQSEKLIRIFYGDPHTGRDSCEEWDVVGRIGRSGGLMKVPLLLADGENFGGSILTERILRIMDVETNKDVYRSSLYEVPNIQIVPLVDASLPEYSWAGYRDNELIARFRTTYEASEWEAFMTGQIATKREEIVNQFKLAA